APANQQGIVQRNLEGLLAQDLAARRQLLLVAEPAQIVQHLPEKKFGSIPHEHVVGRTFLCEDAIEQRLDRLRIAMPFRESLVNDRPLQHEVQTFLRQQRPPAQLQRIPGKKLKRTIQKALQPARTELRNQNKPARK